LIALDCTQIRLKVIALDCTQIRLGWFVAFDGLRLQGGVQYLIALDCTCLQVGNEYFEQAVPPDTTSTDAAGTAGTAGAAPLSSQRLLFEAHVKLVVQRALWQEARTRVLAQQQQQQAEAAEAAALGFLTATAATAATAAAATAATATAADGMIRRGTEMKTTFHTLKGLIGEAVAAGLAAVISPACDPDRT